MVLLYGVHENNPPADTIARVGGNATRPFTANVIGARDLVKPVSNVCGPSWAADATAVWSFKPNPEDVANKRWRPYVEDLGRFLRDNPAKKTAVVVWHEPENDVPKWFADAAAFVKMFETVAAWFRGVHPSLAIAHAALGYRYRDGVDITDTTAKRWRTSADIHCLDIYSGRTNPLATIMPELSGYRRWRQFVAQDSMWGVTERGWTCTPADNAIRVATMAREAQWLATLPNGPEWYLLWNTVGTEGDEGLVFDAGAEQVARAMTGQYAAMAAARIAEAATVPPAPGKTPPVVPAPVSRTVPCPLCAGSGKYTFTV